MMMTKASITDRVNMTDDEEMSIYLLTWNVNGKSPSVALSPLFEFGSDQHDIYVVALQELPLESLVLPDHWQKALESTFESNGYILLRRQRMIYTALLVYVKRQHLTKFYNVQSDSYMLSIFSGKGGVAIRFYLGRLKLCFVGCHLTPHDHHYEQRISDVDQIMHHIHFSNGEHILNQDIAFFLGDLNFRLDGDHLDRQKIIELIVQGNTASKSPDAFEPLLKHDQLNRARAEKRALHHFEEEHIEFAPTYKFEVGTQNYHAERRPAYTDRILHRNALGAALGTDMDWHRMARYNSFPSFTISDHRPVRSVAYIPMEHLQRAKTRLLAARSRPNLGKSNKEVKSKITADSGSSQGLLRTRRHSASSLSSSSSSSSLDYQDEFFLDMAESQINLNDPNLLTPRFRIDFFPVHDWNATNTAGYVAHFRIADQNGNGPVSLDRPEVRRFLSNWDWIGLFPENFHSLEDFVTYSYPLFGRTLVEEAQDAMALLLHDSSIESPDDASSSRPEEDRPSESSSSSRSSGDLAERHKAETTTTTHQTQQEEEQNSSSDRNPSNSNVNSNENVFSVYFDESCPLLQGRYVLLYMRNNGDVLGISDSFVVDANHEFLL